MHTRPWVLAPALHKLSVLCAPVILELWRWVQKNQKFKVTLSYVASQSPYWAV